MSNYCTMCGSPIPEGQKVCSMCYGDPSYGADGYYQEWLDEGRRQHEEQQAIQQAQEARELVKT